MTSINQGNGTTFRSNLRVRSQSESPTLARSSCLHLAPFPARLRACRSLLLTRGSPKPSSHLLSRAMLLLSILNLASRLRTSSRRVKTRSPAALPGDGSGAMFTVISDSAIQRLRILALTPYLLCCSTQRCDYQQALAEAKILQRKHKYQPSWNQKTSTSQVSPTRDAPRLSRPSSRSAATN